MKAREIFTEGLKVKKFDRIANIKDDSIKVYYELWEDKKNFVIFFKEWDENENENIEVYKTYFLKKNDEKAIKSMFESENLFTTKFFDCDVADDFEEFEDCEGEGCLDCKLFDINLVPFTISNLYKLLLPNNFLFTTTPKWIDKYFASVHMDSLLHKLNSSIKRYKNIHQRFYRIKNSYDSVKKEVSRNIELFEDIAKFKLKEKDIGEEYTKIEIIEYLKKHEAEFKPLVEIDK